MASQIDIWNLALSEIGTSSTVAAANEGSEEAIQCGIWYDTLRQTLLRSAPWAFARRQAPLSTLGSLAQGTSPYPWPYKYAYPPDALRVRYILPPVASAAEGSSGAPSRVNRFIPAYDKNIYEQPIKVLLGTVRDAQAVYIVDVTDVAQFDPSFRLALAAMLAYKVCMSLSGNVNLRADFRAAADMAVVSARAADGNEAMPTTDHVPDWITARSGGYAPQMFNEIGNWFIPYDTLNWGS